MKKLSQKANKEINKLRSLFPDEIAVKTRRSRDGGFVAEISTFPGLITEADTFSDLLAMINDAVSTYFEVPKKYASFIPNYQPSIEAAQVVGIFPILYKETKIKMKLTA